MSYAFTSEDRLDSFKMRLPTDQIVTINSKLKLWLAYIDWCNKINKTCELNNTRFIWSNYGRPTAPLYKEIRNAQILYWTSLSTDSEIGYGNFGYGEDEHRARIAAAFTRDYKTLVAFENVIFVVSGKSAINNCINLIQTICPHKTCVLTRPYYTSHLGDPTLGLNLKQTLFVDTLSQRDLRLNAELLEKTLRGIDPQEVGAFIFCDPNNPMGYTLGEQEWRKITRVLLRYTNALVIVDEAYSEMAFREAHCSLLTVAPEELKRQLVIIRSATKALSAAGERMAVILSFREEHTTILAEYNCYSLFHAPISAQFAYSYAIEKMTAADKLELANFYQTFVDKMEVLLRETDFNMKNELYKVDSSFYIVGDFGKLIGKPLDERLACEVFLGEKKTMENDLDIVYHLLFKYKVSFSPMSFFGVSPTLGWLRIVCSFKADEFDILAQKLKEIQTDSLV